MMSYELYELYIEVLYYDYRIKINKIFGNLYHVYHYHDDGEMDGVPRVLKPIDEKFKQCPCCSWKPEE